MQWSSSSENYKSSSRGDSPSKWHGKDDKGQYVYKTSSYQYSTAGKNNSYNNNSSTQNIDQLDALLDDLKNERQMTLTREREPLSSSYTSKKYDPERSNASETIKTIRTIKTTQSDGHPQFDNVVSSEFKTLKSGGYSPVQDTIRTTEFHKDYDYNKNVKLYENKSKISESNRNIEYTDIVPSNSVTQFEKDFKNISLSEDILPSPGTKVTTTVRTYTYEVPSDATHTIRSHHQSNNTLNRSAVKYVDHQTTTAHSPTRPHVPQTVVYNTESYSNINKHTGQPIVSNESYETREHRETNVIRNNNNLPLGPRSPVHTTPDGGHTTKIIYNINRTENVNHLPDHNTYPRGLPPQTSPDVSLPVPGPTTHKYYYKESSNTVNTIHGPPGGNSPNISPIKYTPSNGYPPHGNDNNYPPHQGPNTTVSYKYSSSTMNSRHGGPDYGTPSPNGTVPFPVDYTANNASPPQRVDELMQSFGNTDSVDRGIDTHTIRKKEIDTSVASPNQPHIPTVNRAGKEVYYPPGHEVMITKREEMQAGSQAGGRWAKGSGMYEYESGSKSKSKTKSGGAMVPVCLPLCCAMPCSIM